LFRKNGSLMDLHRMKKGIKGENPGREMRITNPTEIKPTIWAMEETVGTFRVGQPSLMGNPKRTERKHIEKRNSFTK